MARGWVGIRLQDVRSLFVLEMASGCRPVNERLRLDKNVNKAFSPEMGLLMAYYTPKNSPPKSSHGKASFSAQIQDGRHYIGSNIQMGLILEPGNIETHLRCHFQLTLGCPFV